MPKHRTPLRFTRAWTLPTRSPGRGLAGPVLLFLCVTILAACQNDDDGLMRPGESVNNLVTAVYVPPEEFRDHEIVMDGEAKDREWGGPLDEVRRYTQVRLTAENGAGNPGEPIYASVKAVYTDTDLYLLVRWSDPKPDEMKNAMYYVGPDLSFREGCQDVLTDEDNWTFDIGDGRFDEDRLVIAWEIDSAGDDVGAYRTDGCQVACHPGASPAFGRTGFGRLDVWMWLAARTNQLRQIYTINDNPNFPRYGIMGFLDDFTADPVSGLVPDPGRSMWFPNFVEGSARPRWIYRTENDPFYKPMDPSACQNLFGERCRQNNGLPLYYIWREDIERIPLEFSACDTTNVAVLPQGREPRKWRPGDAVGGYYFTYPDGSRANVRGRAVHSEGAWTLELARPLNTDDTANDVIFAGDPGEEAVFTLAVADNSETRHWGSGPQVLVFGPKAGKARGESGK